MTVERFPVEASHILFFARAIGDENPDFAEGRVAPPTFAIAAAQFDPEWPLRPRPGTPWFGSGREASGAHAESRGALHAEQHFEIHTPMRPGRVLRVIEREGRSWEKQSKRGGTLCFTETLHEYRDVETDELVVTARQVGVREQEPVA